MENLSTHSNDFFVTLPCNSSMNFFPENKPHEFKTRLAYPIQLRGKWEVGLAEIIYPHAFRTLSRPLLFCYMYLDVEKLVNEGTYEQLDNEDRQVHYMEIPAGHYGNPQNVIDEILEKLRGTEVEDKLFLHWSRTNGKLYVNLSDGVVIKWQDQMLRKMFGIERLEYAGPGEFVGENVAKLRRGVNALYVYTDIISPVLVGDTAAPLLKIVPVEGKYGEMAAHTYAKLHYVPLQRNYFDTIEINIARDSGKLVYFDRGKVVVKLHFRPRKLAFM